jgi:GTP cyclohydrolase II
VHSACLTGDVFGSKRCDCGDQLARAKSKILEEGAGLLLYMLDHEGRGIGLANKLCAYSVQDQRRLDTLDANVELGLPIDGRDYGDAVDALRHFGLSHVRLLTNNPAKIAVLESAGVTVERVSLCTTIHAQNEAYIRAKVDRMGHIACEPS